MSISRELSKFIEPGGSLSYDNTTSGLSATTIKSAIDELNTLLGGGNVGSQASFDVYDFTSTAAQTTFSLSSNHGKGSNIVAPDLSEGTEYIITALGDTDFTLIGASSNTVGVTFTKTATAGLGTGTAKVVADYIPGYIKVYLNGVFLSETDYVASDGDNIVLDTGADVGALLSVVVLDSFNTATQLRVLGVDAGAPDNSLVIDSSGNVGVAGGVTATGLIEASDGTNGEMQFGLGTALTTGAGTYDSSVRWNGLAGNLLFSQGAVEKMRIDSSGLNVTGDIVLGDNNPTITMNDSSVVDLQHLIVSSSNNLIIAADNNNVDAGTKIELYVDGTERMNVTATGIDVTGSVTADGLTVESGTGNIGIVTKSTDQFAFIGFEDSTSSVSSVYVGADGNDFIARANSLTRFRAASNGDISFYEDTGTSQKLYWDASTESLIIGGGTSWSSNHSLVVGSGGSVGGSQGALFVGKYDATIISGNEVGRIDFGSSFDESLGASISAEADASWTHSSSHPTRLLFKTIEASSITPTERMRIDSSGNVGIGVTPEAWAAFNPVLRIKNAVQGGGGALASSSVDNFRMFANTYFDGAYKRLDVGFATIYEQASGAHIWYSNDSGLADSTFTPTPKMTLDASGNLLVGKTTTAFGTAGIALRGTVADFTRDGGTPINVNRLTSDGSLIDLHKDSAVVGSIGTTAGDIQIGSGDTALRFQSSTDSVFPAQTSGAGRGSAIGLGLSSVPFKDLYLSGFVSGGGSTGLTTRAVVDGGVIALRLQQARGSVTSPTVSNFDGDGNYITSEVYDGAAFNKIAHIGMVTGTSLDDGDILFATAKAGSTTTKMTLDEDGNLLVGTSTNYAKLAVRTSGSTIQGLSVTGDSAGDTIYTIAQFGKFDNNTTTSQVFINFIVNNGAVASGQINANGAGAVAFGSWSDRRLKENITDLPSQLANITALRPVEFDYIESEGGEHQIGFVAQEVEEIYPDLVGERQDGMKTLSGMGKMEARLIKAIQEQQEQIEQLKADIAALKS